MTRLNQRCDIEKYWDARCGHSLGVAYFVQRSLTEVPAYEFTNLFLDFCGFCGSSGLLFVLCAFNDRLIVCYLAAPSPARPAISVSRLSVSCLAVERVASGCSSSRCSSGQLPIRLMSSNCQIIDINAVVNGVDKATLKALTAP